MTVAIRRCTSADVDEVRRFIDEHWARGHVLARSRELVDWQHREADGSYTFMAARDSSGDVLGILGYIPTRRFDPTLGPDRNVVWLTTWKVREHARSSALGIRLLQQVRESEPGVAVGALGLTPSTLPIYRALGFSTGELSHYVFANRSVEHARLAVLERADHPPTGDLDVAMLSPADLAERAACAFAHIDPETGPMKSTAYFDARYCRHPMYAYKLAGLVENGAVVGVLVMRVAEHDGSRALRIVDFAGRPDVLRRSGRAIQALVETHGAEYADVYNAGFDADVFLGAGFRLVDPNGPVIVPDHFEPFERRNVRLFYAMSGGVRPRLFKGESDQDRPNALPLTP